MLGVAIIVLVLLAIPVGFLISTGVAAGIIGSFLTKDAEVRHEGSELVDTNR